MTGRSIIDKTGKRYGRLVVLGPSENRYKIKSGKRFYTWLCKCDCGKLIITSGNNLQQKKVRSCGCWRYESRRQISERTRGYRWKGGRRKARGYILIWKPEHPNAWKHGYVYEHILIMSEYLNRPLEKTERVHHKNGIKDDNSLENLELWTTSHPYGQRVEDLINFSIGYLKKYAPNYLSDL